MNLTMEKILDKIIFTFVSIYFFKNKLKILTDQIFLFFYSSSKNLRIKLNCSNSGKDNINGI